MKVSVIWRKTPAGTIEAKRAVLVQSPAARNLLMVIDGVKSEEMLLRHLIGVQAEDFRTLHKHGLIESSSADGTAASAPAPLASSPALATDRALLAALLIRQISAHLGLAGFVLASSVRQAGTRAELLQLAERTIIMIEQRKGKVVAEDVRTEIFG